MSWNANGLLNHQQELQAILEINKIDVCLISETHFTKQSFIKFRGYKIYHKTHHKNAARSGSVINLKIIFTIMKKSKLKHRTFRRRY